MMLVCYCTLAVPTHLPRSSAKLSSWYATVRQGTGDYYIDASTQNRTLPQRVLAESCSPCLVPAELLSLSTPAPGPPAHQTHNKLMPQTRSQTKADKVDARVDQVAYYLAVAVPVIFLYTVAQNLGWA